MLRILSRLTKLSRIKNGSYFSTSTALNTAYDSDGKTTVTLLNSEPGSGIMVDAVSQAGFRLNNGMFVVGPMILFPKTALSWSVEGDHEINEESLVLFKILEPKLDLLVIGYGNTSVSQPRFDKIIMKLRSVRKFMNIEVLPTEKAASTYNFIVAEGRFVGAALIPPLEVTFFDSDVTLKIKHQQLYED